MRAEIPGGTEVERGRRPGRQVLVLRNCAPVSMEFNVLPGAKVRETFRISEYRVGSRYVEASFDREYHSDMALSPSHLVITTMQVHTQRMAYLAICHELGLPVVLDGPEVAKIWVTKFSVVLPTLVRSERMLVQRLELLRMVPRAEPGSYEIEVETAVEDTVIRATAVVFVLAKT